MYLFSVLVVRVGILSLRELREIKMLNNVFNSLYNYFK